MASSDGNTIVRVTKQYLHERFGFDEKSGRLIWKYQVHAPREWNTKYAGRAAGCVGSNGYRVIRIDGNNYRAARLVWVYHHGEIPDGYLIDHINCARDDDRLQNLRLATSTENAANRKPSSKRDLPKGVYKYLEKYPGRFIAVLEAGGIRKHIGVFPDEKSASEAYLAAARAAYGDFARGT